MTSKAEYKFKIDGSLQYKIWRNEFGQYHREDGPAVEYTNGTKYWYKNGQRHRENGPIIVWKNGNHEYYLNDKEYSKEEYWEEIKKMREKYFEGINDFKS